MLNSLPLLLHLMHYYHFIVSFFQNDLESKTIWKPEKLIKYIHSLLHIDIISFDEGFEALCWRMNKNKILRSVRCRSRCCSAAIVCSTVRLTPRGRGMMNLNEIYVCKLIA